MTFASQADKLVEASKVQLGVRSDGSDAVRNLFASPDGYCPYGVLPEHVTVMISNPDASDVHGWYEGRHNHDTC